MIALLALLACGRLNRPPEIRAVNGQLVQEDLWGSSWLEDPIAFSPGERLELSVEVLEPDLQAVEVWWPESPPGWDFSKDALSGAWEVPLDADPWLSLSLIVTDTAADPAWDNVTVSFAQGGFDTGWF